MGVAYPVLHFDMRVSTSLCTICSYIEILKSRNSKFLEVCRKSLQLLLGTPLGGGTRARGKLILAGK